MLRDLQAASTGQDTWWRPDSAFAGMSGTRKSTSTPLTTPHLGSERVDDVANLLVVEHEIDELCGLDVVDRDRGFVITYDD
jgi:hypothetical protein